MMWDLWVVVTLVLGGVVELAVLAVVAGLVWSVPGRLREREEDREVLRGPFTGGRLGLPAAPERTRQVIRPGEHRGGAL